MNMNKLYTNFLQHVNNMTDNDIREAIKAAEQNSIDDYCQFIDFIPNSEYILYEALIHNGLLPDDERSKTWNNPEAPIHKVWNEFEYNLIKYGRQIINTKTS